MPRITGVEFHRFSAKHRNASHNWLLLKLLTDQPGLYGSGLTLNEEEILKHRLHPRTDARGARCGGYSNRNGTKITQITQIEPNIDGLVLTGPSRR